MRYLLLFIFLLLFSCGTNKHTTKDTYIKKTDESYQSRYKEMYYSLRDSLINVPAPKESSRTHGLMDSYLFTSLAESRAWIDSIGKLNHTINNKDSILTITKWIDRIVTVHDTIFKHTSDTIYVKVHEEVEKEKSLFQQTKETVRDVFLALIILYIAKVAYSFYKKRKQE